MVGGSRSARPAGNSEKRDEMRQGRAENLTLMIHPSYKWGDERDGERRHADV
jgi:hypothetical protein